jgi:microcystin-dependent protein
MAQPYVGEIRLFAGNFPPVGWMFCDGQLLPISENETLFQLIGTTYGGDGQETFALPNMQSRVPVHQSSSYLLGEMAGVETVTLSTSQIPSHSHPLLGSSDPASARTPSEGVFGRTPGDAYASEFTPDTLSPVSVGAVGGSQPHENCQPFLCVNYIISLFGIFPQPT